MGLAARVLAAAMGYDPQDPFSRPLTLAARAFPAAFRFGVPSAPAFHGDDAAPRPPSTQAAARMVALGGTPVAIDFAPLAQAAALLYESALVAERYAAIRPFFDAHEADVVEPVRGIIARGRDYSAADALRRRSASCARWASRPRAVAAAWTCCWCPPRPRTTPSPRCWPTRWR